VRAHHDEQRSWDALSGVRQVLRARRSAISQVPFHGGAYGPRPSPTPISTAVARATGGVHRSVRSFLERIRTLS